MRLGGEPGRCRPVDLREIRDALHAEQRGVYILKGKHVKNVVSAGCVGGWSTGGNLR